MALMGRKPTSSNVYFSLNLQFLLFLPPFPDNFKSCENTKPIKSLNVSMKKRISARINDYESEQLQLSFQGDGLSLANGLNRYFVFLS